MVWLDVLIAQTFLLVWVWKLFYCQACGLCSYFGIWEACSLLRLLFILLITFITISIVYNYKQFDFVSQMSTKSPLRSVSSMPLKPPAFDPSIYVTKNLPLDDVVKLKQCFDIFDYDKSGNVSSEQLLTAIKALGLQKQAGKVLQILNFQSSQSQMDFQTFLKLFGFNGDNQSHSNLKQLFDIFDKNGVGSFGVEEFAEICESVGERFSPVEIEQMIEYADKDRDGRIGFDEFVLIVTKEYPAV